MGIRKPLLLFLMVSALLFVYGCGGGSSGSGYTPPGTGTTEPASVTLYPTRYIAQTNGCIDLYAVVRNDEGAPLGNVVVTFTDLSEPFAKLVDRCGGNPLTSAVTDGNGRAKLTISSTTAGFATVLVQVYNGIGTVRDQKTVFFSSKDVLAVSMRLDADANNNLLYDEASDILLGESPSDTSVKIRARVYNAGGVLLAGSEVKFAAERAYRVGTSILGTNKDIPCSDGSDTCWIAFPLGDDMFTNENGEAFAQMLVGVESLRNFTTNLNVFASADNGASNMKTFFLSPVTVSSITVAANPSVIQPTMSGTASTSTITATALTNYNQPVPDGTAINFSVSPTSCGTITPFGITGVAAPGDGTATATFTAAAATGTCTITASIGSVSASTTVLVTIPLTVIPSSQTVTPGATATFKIFGGIPPYQVVPDIASYPPVPATVNASGDAFTVTVPANSGETTVTYTIMDAVGATVKATLKIVTVTSDFYLLPSEATIPVGGSVTFQIFGGTPYPGIGFLIVVDRPADVNITYDPSIDIRSFTADGLNAATVNIVVQDKDGRQAKGVLTIE
ncbi:MAG: Ig-like domain-containing protein [Nitrospirae bacterium]|nr:Ig-like domain-containing protein [Nitrospirota bacterium]